MAKITRPASRLALAQEKGTVPKDAAARAGKFFPATGGGLKDPLAADDIVNAVPPSDGNIASGGNPALAVLDESGNARWATHAVKAGQALEIQWTFEQQKTRRINYFITKDGWDPKAPLTRAQFEQEPFFAEASTEQPYWAHELRPRTTHQVTLPKRSGYHVLLGVCEVADTGMAFYQPIDLNFA